MTIEEVEIHRKEILAKFTDAEIKQIILDHVRSQTGLHSNACHANVTIGYRLPNGVGTVPVYSAICSLRVDLPVSSHEEHD